MGGSYKGMAFDGRVAPLVRHMPSVIDQWESLKALQGSWETLALLGHLSPHRSDMGDTRQAFDRLAAELVARLADETLAHAASGLGYKAQVAVDILTRNLFERTADIGFLATDAEVVAAATGDARALAALPGRFERYASLYSVYRDIVLLGADGQVLARMREGFRGRSDADFVRRAAAGGYVEHHGTTDVCGLDEPALSYSSTVAGKAGVLTLVFDLTDEARGIFEGLAGPEELLAFVDDRSNRVVLSNDPVRLPPGHPAPRPGTAAHVRLAGQTYIAVQRRPPPYQGYAGPGWSALALVPADVAFEPMQHGAADEFSGEGVFSAELRAIPLQAAAIQNELNRFVWNGQLRQTDGTASDFSRALLAEIASTGRRTQGIFEAATAELRTTVTATLLEEARLLSRLAVDIFDRNLYERACDCRWWTEDAFLKGLEPVAGAAVLQRLNELYTVYVDILLFDASARVVAASRNPAHVGRTLEAPWIEACLRARDGARYAVSPFCDTALYGGAATYVYSAPLRVDGRAVGGLALVFDSTPQFASMLTAALPTRAGSIAAFLRPDGSTISATGELPVQVPERVLTLRAGASWSGTLVQDGLCYAVGATASSGYREFKTSDGYVDDVIALVIVPSGARLADRGADRRPLTPAAADGLEVATFRIGSQLYGLPSADVTECIALTRHVRMPGRRDVASRHHGYATWHDATLPLIDIRADLGEPAATPLGHAIVIERQGTTFGMLVSELAEVVKLRVTPTAATSVVGKAGGLVDGLGQSGQVLVPVLSASRLARLSGAPLPRPSSTLEPDAATGVGDRPPAIEAKADRCVVAVG